MGQDKIPMTKKRIKFLETYNDLDDSETLKEILYAHTLQVEKLEKYALILQCLFGGLSLFLYCFS